MIAPAWAVDHRSSADNFKACQENLSDPKVSRFGQVYLAILREWLRREQPSIAQDMIQNISNPNSSFSLFRFPTELNLTSIHLLSLKSSMAVIEQQSTRQLSHPQQKELEIWMRTSIQDIARLWRSHIDESQSQSKKLVDKKLSRTFKFHNAPWQAQWTVSYDGQHLFLYYEANQRKGFKLFQIRSSDQAQIGEIDAELQTHQRPDTSLLSLALYENSQVGAFIQPRLFWSFWNTVGHKILTAISSDDWDVASDIALSPNHHWIALGTNTGKVKFFDVSDRTPNRKSSFEIQEAESATMLAQWLGDGSKLITIEIDEVHSKVVIWDWATRTRLNSPITFGGKISEWKISNDQKYLAVFGKHFGESNTLELWDLSTLHKLWQQSADFPDFEFSPDSQTLAIGSDLKFNLLSTQSLAFTSLKAKNSKQEDTFEEFYSSVFDPSGRWLVVAHGTVDQELKWWDLKEHKWAGSWPLQNHRKGLVWGMKFTSDRKSLAVERRSTSEHVGGSIEVFDYLNLLEEIDFETRSVQ